MASYVFPLPAWVGAIDLHHGTDAGASDLMAARGWPVVSITSGTVVYVGSDALGGNNVTVQGDDNLQYYYAHFNDAPLVTLNQRVQAGTRLGSVGNTGNAESTPPHLHIGIGHTIASGAGPHGGAGDIDAVAFLRAIKAGQKPNVSDNTIDPTSAGGSGGGVLGGITDATTAALAALLSAALKPFTALLKG